MPYKQATDARPAAIQMLGATDTACMQFGFGSYVAALPDIAAN